ncbi:MAG: extracellular solute-binding protein, partial [Caldilineaceae bacterium]|nr:extracellular solute-binding protein [Caldilineaceae bacterium]
MRRQQLSILAMLLVFALLLTTCPAAAPAAEPATPAEEAAAETAPESSEAASDEVIEIEYWQYNFGARIDAMNQLITMFEAENPGIKVIHNSDIPYDDFRDKIATSVPAGVGPDVATLFYGWQNDWIDAGYLVPLPEEYFPMSILDDFSSMVQASVVDGQLYTLPTAVRSLALFYNKDLMAAAGLDPENPPTTLTELEEQAVQCTVKDGETFEVYGFIVNPGGQAHHWFRQVLLPQFGQEPLSDDQRTVQWNASEGGYEAWAEFLKFETELGTGVAGVYENDPDGFLAGEVCFHIDGSFRLGSIASSAPDLNFGVAELPEHNGVKATFGSYWTHGITQKGASDPARLEASAKFLQFITSAEAGDLWVDIVGELPAQLAAANDDELLADPKLGA